MVTVSHRGVYKEQELRILEHENSQGLRAAFGLSKAQRPVSGGPLREGESQMSRELDNVPFLSYSELSSSKQNQKIGKRWGIGQGEASVAEMLATQA